MAPYVRTVSEQRAGARASDALAGRSGAARPALRAGRRAGAVARGPRLAAQDPRRHAEAFLHRHLRLPATATAARPRASRASSTRAATSRSSRCWTACRARSCARTTRCAATCRTASVVKVERARARARASRRCCPSSIGALARHYEITHGRDAAHRRLRLPGGGADAKDDLRYGHKLYADVTSGMLLQARHLRRRRASSRAVQRSPSSRIGSVHARHGAGRGTRRSSWRVEDARGRAGQPGRLGAAQRAARVPQDHRAQAPPAANRGRSGRWCTPTGSRRSRCSSSRWRDAASRCAPGLASVGAINIYTREVAEPHGHRGRRGAGGERAADRERGRVPPPAVETTSQEIEHRCEQ